MSDLTAQYFLHTVLQYFRVLQYFFLFTCCSNSRGAVRSTASSYAAMRTLAGSRPVLVIVWEWHISLALLCGCLGALEYPTTNSCGPINKSLSLSLSLFSCYYCVRCCKCHAGEQLYLPLHDKDLLSYKIKNFMLIKFACWRLYWLQQISS